MLHEDHTNEQIIYAMQHVRGGKKVADVCREMGISEPNFYAWKKRYDALGVSEVRELRQLRDENRELKQLVADRTLDRHVLQEIVRKKLSSPPCRVSWPVGRTKCFRSARMLSPIGKIKRKLKVLYLQRKGLFPAVELFPDLVRDVLQAFYTSQVAWDWLGYDGPPMPCGCPDLVGARPPERDK